jgi:hypothetical protein
MNSARLPLTVGPVSQSWPSVPLRRAAQAAPQMISIFRARICSKVSRSFVVFSGSVKLYCSGITSLDSRNKRSFLNRERKIPKLASGRSHRCPAQAFPPSAIMTTTAATTRSILSGLQPNVIEHRIDWFQEDSSSIYEPDGGNDVLIGSETQRTQLKYRHQTPEPQHTIVYRTFVFSYEAQPVRTLTGTSALQNIIVPQREFYERWQSSYPKT